MAKVKPVRIKRRRKPGLLAILAPKYAMDADMGEKMCKALFPAFPRNGETLQWRKEERP